MLPEPPQYRAESRWANGVRAVVVIALVLAVFILLMIFVANHTDGTLHVGDPCNTAGSDPALGYDGHIRYVGTRYGEAEFECVSDAMSP